MYKILFLPLFLWSCADPCYFPSYDWGFNYKIEVDVVTERNIQVDTSGQELGDEFFDMLDEMTQNVEACLIKNFPEGNLKDIKEEAFCRYEEFYPICDKNCLQVKVPNDWHMSSDGKNQLLQDKAPGSGCEDKELDPEKPCYWRAGLQDGHVIVTTPNLYLYKDPLIKYITRCDSIWNIPEFAECANPGVEPDWND